MFIRIRTDDSLLLVDRSIPLTSSQAIFLIVIKGANKALSGSEIVEGIQSTLGENSVPTPGAVYKILRYLREQGYIKELYKEVPRKKDGSKDGRVHPYILTSAGEKMVDHVFNHVAKIFSFICNCCDISNISIDSSIKLLLPEEFRSET